MDGYYGFGRRMHMHHGFHYFEGYSGNSSYSLAHYAVPIAMTNPLHKDGALRQLARRPAPSIGGEEGVATSATKLVSAAPALWKNVRLGRQTYLEEIWKQVWPLQFAAERSGVVPEAEAQQVTNWMKSLREGDEIALSLSEESVVQDVALYSRFGLVLYSALA